MSFVREGAIWAAQVSCAGGEPRFLRARRVPPGLGGHQHRYLYVHWSDSGSAATVERASDTRTGRAIQRKMGARFGGSIAPRVSGGALG